MCQSSFSISLSKQKRVVTVENMRELPKTNTRVVSVLKQCIHYHFLSGEKTETEEAYGHCLLERPTMASPLGSPQ